MWQPLPVTSSDAKPWWRRLDGVPPERSEKLASPSSRWALQNPWMAGGAIGLCVAVLQTLSFGLVFEASWMSAVLLGVGFGAVLTVLFAEGFKFNARRTNGGDTPT